MNQETSTEIRHEEMPTIEEGLRPGNFPRRRNRAAEREKKLQAGARRFYRVYFITIAVVLCLFLLLMIPLHSWLVRFETTQPDHRSQEVFTQLFASQDWGKLYDAAKLADTEFETRDDFITYMQARVSAAADKEITFYETSAGLSKDHKYVVQLGKDRLATFTLAGTVDEKSGKTEWSISSLQLDIVSSKSIRIQRLPGYTVLLNGKEVSDAYLVRLISTKAEDYLPEGVHGYVIEELCVDGLMAEPIVEVRNEEGYTVPTVFSVADNCYQLDLPVAEMTDAEKNVILGAAKANALFAIRAVGTGELSKYFDYTTQIYKDICNTPTFIQTFASYQFDESVTEISDFYRYNDDLFSARVTLQLDITRKNGTVKSLEMNTTYIFARNAAGTFMVSNITNVDLQQQLAQVRLDFDCDGTIVDSVMVAADTAIITLPQVTAADGKELLGWATREVAANGQVTMNILFVPDANGTAPVPSGTLEPMTLYAVFGEEGAVRDD
ncbi:MAG: hypothetical protein IJO72_01940 [Oscillospiraceae bacterium]|nr:hypothetical protein [Oscillospiraceae bacterium]